MPCNSCKKPKFAQSKISPLLLKYQNKSKVSPLLTKYKPTSKKTTITTTTNNKPKKSISVNTLRQIKNIQLCHIFQCFLKKLNQQLEKL